MSKILITGATGFLGKNFTKELIARGSKNIRIWGEKASCSVRILTRKKENAADLSGVEVFEGDVTKPKTLKNAFEGVDIVFHFAGMLGGAAVPDRVYEELNYGGTVNTVDCAVEQGVSLFVHCSSAGVQGPIKNPPADESLPCAPSNLYEDTKTRAEKYTLRAFREKNLPAVVLRPEFVYGPGDLHVLNLFKAIAKGMFVVFGRGESLLHPTFIDDCTQAFLLCLEKKDLAGEVFIIAGERAVTVTELADTIAVELGVREPLHVPFILGQIGAIIMEKAAEIIPFSPPLTQARLKFFTENRSFVIDKARKKLGYKPKYSFQEGVKKTVGWYKENGHL